MERAGLEMAHPPLLGPPAQVLCTGEGSVHNKHVLEGSNPKAPFLLITAHYRAIGGGPELASDQAFWSRPGFFPWFTLSAEQTVAPGP